ncbi:MAG: sigma-70 family RNA polymerase sigma factor [Streptosporangiales bacterium]|nr:sigma-70 family RNA polymerase sigma factor [Streptosporangiales bacterium]
MCLGDGHPPATFGCLDSGGEPGEARADDCQVWFHKTGLSAWCPPSWKVAGNLWKVPANLPGVDPENVAAAQQGDALALDRLLDELAPYVRRLCARIAPAAADDATQEALLAVFRGLPSLRAPEAIMTWVRSVTVRTAVRLACQHDLEVAAEGTLMGRYASSLEGLVDIDDALARLPVSQRVVLVLRVREGLSEQEIATTLGIPTGTVKSRLHRARAAFREVWES